MPEEKINLRHFTIIGEVLIPIKRKPNIEIIPIDLCVRRCNINTKFNCRICSKEFKSHKGKLLHEWGLHVKDPLECICGRLFINKTRFIQHLARHNDVFIILYLMCKKGVELGYIICKLERIGRFNREEIDKIKYILRKRKTVEDFDEVKMMVDAYVRHR